MKIVPPNFGYVEENVFRCGSPEPRQFGFLSSLNLRTCVVLTDTLDEAFVRWMRESGIQIMCPLLSASSVSTSSTRRGATGYGAGDRDSGSPRGDGRDGRASNYARSGGGTGGDGDDDLDLASRLERTGVGSGKMNAGSGVGGGGGAGRRPGEGLGAGTALGGTVARDGNSSAPWPDLGTGTSDTGRGTAPSNAARFLKENNAYASPVTRSEPCMAYMRNGSSLFVPDDVTPDMTNTIGRGLMTLPEPVVVSILQVILDARHYPLLITCAKGRYRTGIVCGCLRKLQGWNLVSILEEYRRYAGNKSRAENEEYIELFDTDLVNVEVEGSQRPSILYGP